MEKSPARNWDWLSASLLFLLIQVASARLVTTNWTTFLYFSETLAALGTILGLALGASTFGRRTVMGLALAYTVIFVPWQMTGAVTDNLFFGRLTHISGMLDASFDLFMQKEPVHDSLFFVAFTCIVFWLISLAAGYWLVRHNNILVAILPSFMVIMLVQIYDNDRASTARWLAVFMLLALLLLGREYYLQNRRIWTKRRVFINEESWSNIFSGLFIIVTAAVVIAWLMPTSLSSLQSAADSWGRVTRPLTNRLSNAVSSLNRPYRDAGGNYYGATLSLGRDAGQGNSPVFTVSVLNPPDGSLRYYWRGRVYDSYKNGQWSNSPATSLGFQPNNGDLKIPDLGDRSEASLRFTIQFPSQSLIYTPSQPVWVDKPGNVIAAVTDTKLDDVLTWETSLTIKAGEQYQVRAEIADPDIQQLRSAGIQYPQWVKDRYLEVPDNIQPDLKDLADQVSTSQDDPYDKAQAITNYLRANIQYAASLPEPPAGRDPVLWVLFDYKKGFCNYYASAEVLMLRSMGIPARLAVGFAQGQYQDGDYIVRQRDAHAWPEVYFPGIGWVEFEPTVSQDTLVRPDVSLLTSGPGSSIIAPPRKPIGELGGLPNDKSKNVKIPLFTQTLPGRVLTISSIIIGVFAAIFLLRRYQVLTYVPVYLSKTLEKGGITSPKWVETWARWNQSEPIERSFAVINWSLNQLGKPQPVDATPAERSLLLKKLLPSAVMAIDALTYEFEAGLFTARAADLARALRSSVSIVLHILRARIDDFISAHNPDI